MDGLACKIQLLMIIIINWLWIDMELIRWEWNRIDIAYSVGRMYYAILQGL